MRFLRVIIVSCILLCGVSATPAAAQDKVGVRSGGHEGYTRLVFEWARKTDYSLSREGGRILIRFAKAGTLDLAGLEANDPNIMGVDVLSKAGESLQAAVRIPEGSRFRDFVVENKLIVDVYDTKEAKAAPEKTVPPKEDKPKQVEKKGDFSVTPAQSEEAVPVVPVEVKPVAAPTFDPHVITLTNTTSFGVAAFVRSGWLWIISDVPDLPITPQIGGPQKDRFPRPEKVDISGVTAWRMDIPEGMRVYGDGGGLGWRFIVTAKEREFKPLPVKTQLAEGASRLIWPLMDMQKVLRFTDPLVGDSVTVVTATDSSQYAGPGRGYVHLRVLDSIVGLAFLPRSDDVKADIGLDQVSVGRPGGLSLSKVEAPPPVPKQEIKKPLPGEKPSESSLEKVDAAHEAKTESTGPTPGEMFKAGGEKPSGNNVYNFVQWEMGGIPALEKNQHVMMVEISSKKEDIRVEDILTMAKLNLANDRGVEALGLLNIAMQKVPELEDNAEFIALRGAAFALADMYDEAIVDYSRDALKNYDDVKYWRAYTLAGLEDWRQAIEVMPKTFKEIAAYPKAIRTPLALTFAEIALRGGDTSMAEGILAILKGDLPKLTLPYASSWNYLTGEAQRQKGHPDKAVQYWEPLVKAGKDDLFRAKAGLSLTKLQLDTKKIKPDEAINTLEGLRYAWRGDELETLINYRLGQVYIDNKDYLKGLTVLRNAATLSPDSDINKDVNDYLNKSFRDIFTNDRLKAMSPLEAISLYEDFKELIPPGDEGNGFVEKLAERLVDADLLGRAAALLEYQVNHRLKGDKKAEIAIRLAAIRLLDGNPDGALRSLEIAQDTLTKMEAGILVTPAPEKKAAAESVAAPAIVEKADPEKQRQVYLLKARALSMKKKTDEAMAVLEAMRLDPDVNRLRTDIAWTAGRWDEAARALNDLITAEDISPSRPLTDYQRDIILNRAIALNLGGDRVALANLRDRYNARMAGTDKGKMFDVVTRPRKPDMIGSREAIQNMISEIDLFKGFLDGYAKMNGVKKPDVTVPQPKPSVEQKPVEAVTTP